MSRKSGAELPQDPNERARALAIFAGKWVAVHGNRVVAAEESVDLLYDKLTSMHRTDATIFRVPDPKQGIFVGLG